MGVFFFYDIVCGGLHFCLALAVMGRGSSVLSQSGLGGGGARLAVA